MPFWRDRIVPGRTWGMAELKVEKEQDHMGRDRKWWAKKCRCSIVFFWHQGAPVMALLPVETWSGGDAVSAWTLARQIGGLCGPSGKGRTFPAAASIKQSQFIQLVVLNLPQILPRLQLCHYLKWNRSATTLSSTPMSSSLCFPSQEICVPAS